MKLTGMELSQLFKPTANREQGMEQLRNGDFAGAYASFIALTKSTPDDWYAWYGAGQSARYLSRLDEASALLERAVALNEHEPVALLALGIAQQLTGRLDDAVQTFLAAIRIDEDYALAYNSLALTQRKQGELDKAVHNYEAGTLALARKFVRTMVNSRANPVLPFRAMPGNRWTECAAFGAMFHGSVVQPVDRVAFPTGDQAIRFEQTGEHAGLLYLDERQPEESVRLFLPNYFHTFREYLRAEGTFAQLVGNQGTCFDLMGMVNDAQGCFAEAEAFSQR